MLHVVAMYIKDDFIDMVPVYGLQWASFYRTIVQFAVPIFVMLSGAFLINKRNVEWKKFYTRMLYRIIIPTFIFSIIYVCVSYGENYVAYTMGILEEFNKWEPLQNWLNGRPSTIMWYMYMIVGLYIITPVLVRVKESVSKRTYFILGIVLFIYGIIVTYTCTLSWILEFIQWIGYFVVGNVIFDFFIDSKCKKIGCGLIILSYSLLIMYWFYFSYREKIVDIPGSFSLVVLVGSVLQFVGFSLLPDICRVDKITYLLSNYSLEIYLIHPLFTEVLMQVSGRILKKFLPVEFVPLYTIVIVVLSCMMGMCYTKLMGIIIKRKLIKIN